MKKIAFMAVAAAVMFSACGGGNDEKKAPKSGEELEEVAEAQTATVPFLSSMPIEGKHADYFEIVGEDIELAGAPDGNMGTIRATVKLNVVQPFGNLKGFAVTPPMTLYFLDADKEKVGSSRLEMSSADRDAILAELKKDNPGTVEISYKGEFYPSVYNEIFSKAKYVQIQSANLSDGTKSSSSSGSAVADSSSSDGDDNTSSSSGNDVDDYLDTYEKIVDSYESFCNKLANGDMSAMADYAKMTSDINDASNKVSKLKNQFTAAQLKRFNDLAARQAAAAQKIADAM